MKRRSALAALGASMLVAMGGPGVALAAGGSASTTPLPNSTSPFSPGVPLSPPTVPTATNTPTVAQATTSSSGSSGLSGSNALTVAAVAIIVLTGIAYFIWRDARRHAPARRAAAGSGPEGPTASRGSKPPPKPRKLSPAERRRRKRGRARR